MAVTAAVVRYQDNTAAAVAEVIPVVVPVHTTD
jgi:hypothetical protein